MKLKISSINFYDLILGPLVGIAALLSTIYGITFFRLLFGFIFVFFASGFSVIRLLSKHENISVKIIVASLISLLLTYPAALLTVIIEGQGAEAIYSRHLETSLITLLILSIGLSFIFSTIKRKVEPLSWRFKKPSLIILLPFLIYALFVFWDLNRADVYGDEYDLAYQAYDLVDGITAGRKAFTVSFNMHPPLSTDIKHFSLNLLQPSGFDNLEDWQFRFSEGIIGSLLLLVLYTLADEIFGKKVAALALWLASTNNYLIWLGRIYHREIYLTFFMSVSVFFFLRLIKNGERRNSVISGIALGAALLVKETAIILIITYLIIMLMKKRCENYERLLFKIALLLFSPILAYNLAAYLTTGYADVFFSAILNINRPLSTPASHNPLANTISMASYLSDIYSPAIAALMLIMFIFFCIREKSLKSRFLILWLFVSIAFFSFSAIRAYYFSFITVPLLIILSKETIRIKAKLKLTANIVILLILITSATYSFNTNLSRSYSLSNLTGVIDGSLIVKRPINAMHSLSLRPWMEDFGYKRLQIYLDQMMKQGDCLTVDPEFNNLAARRYTGHLDGIKEYYLGKDYLKRYRECSPEPTINGERFYLTSNKIFGDETEYATGDNFEKQKYYIYTLEKKENL